MGIDDHSALSFIAGIIHPSSGSAWQYVGDRLSGKTVSTISDEVAVHYRYVRKKISLDPTKQLEIICHLDKLYTSQATHVVVAVAYGLEAFCRFSHKNQLMVNGKQSLEKLLNHAKNFADSLLNDRTTITNGKNYSAGLGMYSL